MEEFDTSSNVLTRAALLSEGLRLTIFRVGILIFTLLFLMSQGCFLKPNYLKKTREFAKSNRFQSHIFETKSSQILVFIKKSPVSRVARIYIEGDGLAWISRYKVSPDPTPTEPVGLKLAAVDKSKDSIIYLARPCQYIMSPQCQPSDWTSGRYGRKIVDIYQEILDQLKAEYDVFHLYGFSGGATVALLVAAERQDVKSVTTFAGLLDIDAWTQTHHYSPLTQSMNPAEWHEKLEHLPQRHFVGLADKQLPVVIAEAYRTRFKDTSHLSFIFVPKYGHHSDWSQFWKQHQTANRLNNQ